MTLIKSISGIRGTIGGQPGTALTPTDVVKYSAAFGSWVRQQDPDAKIVVGRDARVSGEMINKLVTATLQSVGINVVDIGLAATPTVEIAVTHEKANGGIIITASHNPGQWNALKLLDAQGEFISADAGAEVLKIAENEDYEFVSTAKLGWYATKEDYTQIHIDKILALPEVDAEAIRKRNFKIAIDCVNSVGGIAIPMLLTALGVKHVEKFFCEPTGVFQHNPEPVPENLSYICGKIEQGAYDLGIVVDPDVDRLVLIQENGAPFGEEYTLVAVADYILSLTPGNTVSNLSSSIALRDVTEKRGGTYAAAPVGEVNVVAAMKETNAVIGGEGNGGVIFPKLHYGRDALVGIALFLTHLAKYGKPISRLKASYPSYQIAKLKLDLTPDLDIDALLEGVKEKYSKMEINTQDGVKIYFDREWVHLRKSNTEPIIRIIAESDSLPTAEHLANKLISDIREIIASGKIQA